mgnify:CR=1 FL=1
MLIQIVLTKRLVQLSKDLRVDLPKICAKATLGRLGEYILQHCGIGQDGRADQVALLSMTNGCTWVQLTVSNFIAGEGMPIRLQEQGREQVGLQGNNNHDRRGTRSRVAGYNYRIWEE